MTIPALLRRLRARSPEHLRGTAPKAEGRALTMRPTVYLPPALAERFLRRIQGSHHHSSGSLSACPALCGG